MSATLEKYRLPLDDENVGLHVPVSPADPPLAAGTLVGEFVIGRKIGEGAMATVYSAVHPVIDKRAAVKVMSRQLGNDDLFYARFVQEARAVNRVRHPNIVDVFGFGRLDDGRCYLMMDLLEGETLGERLRRGALPLDEAIAILVQACEGLEATHEQGIVHRDLKPENVFLAEVRGAAPRVKLLDFGIAKLLDNDVRPLRTRGGDYVGTPSYNSPEQARGEEVSHLTDVYSLGVMAFEMFTGQLPFQATSVVEVQAMHIGSPPPSARSIAAHLPPALDLLLMKMLAKNSAERPELPEVRAALAAPRLCQEALLDTAAAGEISHQARPAKANRSFGLWMAASLLALVIAFALVGSSAGLRTPTASLAPVAARIVTPDAGPPAPMKPAAKVRSAPPEAAAPARPVRKVLLPARAATRAPSSASKIASRDNYLLNASGRPR